MVKFSLLLCFLAALISAAATSPEQGGSQLQRALEGAVIDEVIEVITDPEDPESGGCHPTCPAGKTIANGRKCRDIKGCNGAKYVCPCRNDKAVCNEAGICEVIKDPPCPDKVCPTRHIEDTCGHGPDGTGIEFENECGKTIKKKCPFSDCERGLKCSGGYCVKDCKPPTCPLEGVPDHEKCGSIPVYSDCSEKDEYIICNKCKEDGSSCEGKVGEKVCKPVCKSKGPYCPKPLEEHDECGELYLDDGCGNYENIHCTKCTGGTTCEPEHPGAKKGKCVKKCTPDKSCPGPDHTGKIPCGQSVLLDKTKTCGQTIYKKCDCPHDKKCEHGYCVPKCSNDPPCPEIKYSDPCGDKVCVKVKGCPDVFKHCTTCKHGSSCVNNVCKKNTGYLRG